MWAKLTKHWFLISLAICFATGYLAADPLQRLEQMSLVRNGIVFAVMWAMGVTLQADTVRQSIQRPAPALLAIGLNIALVPLLCVPLRWVLPAHLFGGLFIASLVPCTLASASVWTRKADGDDSVAMMTTVVTNLACVVVVPIGIALVLARQIQITAGDQVGKLALLVVAPLVLAQAMRYWGAGPWADRHKRRLSIFAQLGILAMVLFGAVASATKVRGVAADPVSGWWAGGLLIAMAIAVHTVALYVGVWLARRMGMDRSRQIAVGIAGSQKTLMVGLQIAIDCGVSVIPMLVYHLSQLVIDTVVAQRWKQQSHSMLEHQTSDR